MFSFFRGAQKPEAETKQPPKGGSRVVMAQGQPFTYPPFPQQGFQMQMQQNPLPMVRAPVNIKHDEMVVATKAKNNNAPQPIENGFSDNRFYQTLIKEVADDLDGNNEFWDLVAFHGFSRKEVHKLISERQIPPKDVCCLALAGAIRGNNLQKLAEIKLPSGKTMAQYTAAGVLTRSGRGAKVLTLPKIAASLPEVVVPILFHNKESITKKVSCDLPEWLQFPAVTGIAFDEAGQMLVREYLQGFSNIIGGAYSEDIYNQAQINAQPLPADCKYYNEMIAEFPHFMGDSDFAEGEADPGAAEAGDIPPKPVSSSSSSSAPIATQVQPARRGRKAKKAAAEAKLQSTED